MSQRYLESRVRTMKVADAESDPRDIGIYHWRRQAIEIIEQPVRDAATAGVEPVPILGAPDWLDLANLKRFQ